MTALSIQPTFPIFTDIDGQPLEDGYVFIGTANLNPITNPITVYWDAALTLPAAQPIRTRGGYPINSGTPARLYVNSDYSIQVQNKNGSVVYSAPAATDRFSDVVVQDISSTEVTFIQAGTGAVTRTAQAKMRETVSVKDFGAVGDGVADDTAAIQAAIDYAETGDVSVYVPAGQFTHASTLTVPRDVTIYGEGESSRLHYSGSGVGIRIQGQRSSLRRLKLRTSNSAATVCAVKFDASVNDLLYWRLHQVTISADSRIANQTAILFENTASTAIFYGLSSDLIIENFGKSIVIISDVTFGINANVFTNTKIQNSDTCIATGLGDGNIFSGLLLDLYTLGISCNGIRNQFIGVRQEGGGGDVAYNFGASSQENIFVGTCQTGGGGISTDAGLYNMIWEASFGAAKPWAEPIQYIAPFNPILADGDGTVPAGANNARFVKLGGITKAMNAVDVRLEVTVQSGNISLAIYELSGTTLKRIATTGAIPCPAVGGALRTLTTVAPLNPAKVYYAAISADNVTAKFKAKINAASNLMNVNSSSVQGQLVYETTAGGVHPLPSTVSTVGLPNNTTVMTALIVA
ncbi:MAG: hypothetical protein RLZZ09_3251 [Pseudomonadota bacterium]|jgi:hypothetical protein